MGEGVLNLPPAKQSNEPAAPSAGARQTSLIQSIWIDARDGNPTAMALFQRHYTARVNRRIFQFVGPGEKLVLITPDGLALFVWRKFIDHAIPPQTGVNCAVFRNEGPQLSSFLISEAEKFAWDRWPGERLYTYVDSKKIRPKKNPGFCFLCAGWNRYATTKGGLEILEHIPEGAPRRGPPTPDRSSRAESAGRTKQSRDHQATGIES